MLRLVSSLLRYGGCVGRTAYGFKLNLQVLPAFAFSRTRAEEGRATVLDFLWRPPNYLPTIRKLLARFWPISSTQSPGGIREMDRPWGSFVYYTIGALESKNWWSCLLDPPRALGSCASRSESRYVCHGSPGRTLQGGRHSISHPGRDRSQHHYAVQWHPFLLFWFLGSHFLPYTHIHFSPGLLNSLDRVGYLPGCPQENRLL